MDSNDMAAFTVSESPKFVSVSPFRALIEQLERIIRVDLSACSGAIESARCLRLAQRIGGELIGTSCKRATEADWIRRETAIEASTTAIMRTKAVA